MVTANTYSYFLLYYEYILQYQHLLFVAILHCLLTLNCSQDGIGLVNDRLFYMDMAHFLPQHHILS